MKIIILGEELAHSHSYEFQLRWLHWAAIAVGCFCLGFVLAVWVAMDRGQRIETTQSDLDGMRQQLLFEQNRLNEFYTYVDSVFTEYSIQAGSLQARLARIEALGGRLAQMADFDEEFDFSAAPAVGGPDNEMAVADHGEYGVRADILQTLSQLSESLSERENQLRVLDSLLASRRLGNEQNVTGLPVHAGWLSSSFGKRIDPFHGHMAWHSGVDFAGQAGSDILSVASGIVVWSGEQYGYGQMVEIDHGNGLSTRYAHNLENKVHLGDVVEKGQLVARMGTSGRSTGYHVHFEVLKDGKAVDPASYIYRKTL